MAIDYLVLDKFHHSYFICATDATQSVAPIYWFISKDTILML